MDALADLKGRLGKVDHSIGFGEFGGDGGERMVLRLAFQLPLFEIIECFEDDLRAEYGESIMQLASRFVRINWCFLGGEDVTGVHSIDKRKDRIARSCFSVNHCPVNGGGTSILRQK